MHELKEVRFFFPLPFSYINHFCYMTFVNVHSTEALCQVHACRPLGFHVAVRRKKKKSWPQFSRSVADFLIETMLLCVSLSAG